MTPYLSPTDACSPTRVLGSWLPRRFARPRVHSRTLTALLLITAARASAQSSPAFEIVLGAEEQVLANGQWGMTHTPDGAVSFRRDSSGVRLWFPCKQSTCELRGPSLESLKPATVVNGRAQPTFGPSGSGFDSNYAGAYSVVQAYNSSDLLMFYHAEQHPCGTPIPFIASIGLARSRDGGNTWERKGQILKSTTPAPAGCSYTMSGVVTPSIVISRDGRYLYMYFLERVPNRRDEIYLARSPVEANGAPGSWQRWTEGKWIDPTLSTPPTAVIRTPDPVLQTVFAGLPNVSFNRELNRYLTIFQTTAGIYYTSSEDGINWDAGRALVAGPTIGDPTLASGTPVQSYPGLVSPSQSSQSETDESGFVYFARGTVGGNPPHHMVRRSFKIVSGSTTLRTTAAARNVSALSGSNENVPDSVEVWISGAGGASRNWTASAGSSSRVTLETSSGPGGAKTMLRWKSNVTGLPPGVYHDTISLSAPGAAVSRARIVTTLTVVAPELTVACAVQDLMTRPCLPDAGRRFLDIIGNNDGTYNLGDLLAYLKWRDTPSETVAAALRVG
jgi:hypothetical protein